MHAVFKYSYHKLLELIKKRIKKENIPFVNPNNPEGPKNVFNNKHLDLFLKFYDMKSNQKYCYQYPVGSSQVYSYSDAALIFIFDEIKKNPEHIIQDLKASIAKK